MIVCRPEGAFLRGIPHEAREKIVRDEIDIDMLQRLFLLQGADPSSCPMTSENVAEWERISLYTRRDKYVCGRIFV